MPMYPKIQEVSTMADLRKTSAWSWSEPGPTASGVPSSHPVAKADVKIAGRNRSVENRVLSHSTGSTALSVRAFFFAAS